MAMVDANRDNFKQGFNRCVTESTAGARRQSAKRTHWGRFAEMMDRMAISRSAIVESVKGVKNYLNAISHRN